MQLKLLVETAILLAVSQFVLGVAGYLLKGISWAALPVVFFLGWMIVRTARIFREEMGRAMRRGVSMTPWVTALVVAVLWQLPALACVPAWAPAPAIRLWQGALLPIPGTLELLGSHWLQVEPLLWLMIPVEIALFVWAAARNVMPVRRFVPQSGVALSAAGARGGSGEWVPARRRKDIRRRQSAADLEEQPEAEPDTKE
ncbi:MAG: hypothetical protein JWN15_415 [Firmicutes bacterium]|nr:hypothetical protein [Bacillota bacterium]